MPYYRSVGDVPDKRHVHHTDAHGHRFAEELIGQEGFSSDSSLVYHRHSPSALTAIHAVDAGEVGGVEPWATAADASPVAPTHVRTPDLPVTATADLVSGRRAVLVNADVEVSWVESFEPSELYRNAIGDELVYVQHGTGRLESVFGMLDVGPGDYVVVPTATTHRWVVTGDGPLGALVIVSRGHVRSPGKYRSTSGQFLEHAPYCERDVRGPDRLTELDAMSAGERDVPVLVRTRSGWTRHVHRDHPFDVVGWDGWLYPWALSIHDFEPIVGRLHQPPPVHQTFELPAAVVCSFVPRLYDFHPEAVKVPYHHANTDSDEVLFYSAGNFMSRAGSGIDVGSISFHPAGFTHGPQPGSVEASLDADRTEEIAVMLDTFAPLHLTAAAQPLAVPDYPFSWSRKL